MDYHRGFLRKPFLALILTTIIAALFSTSAWGLPPALEAKKNWLGVENALEKDDYAKALKFLENMNTLGVELKPDYYFQYGRSLIKSGKSSKGLDYLNRYIEKAGEEGEYVEWALELMIEGEEQVAMTKKQEEEVRAYKKLVPEIIAKLESDMVAIPAGVFHMGKHGKKILEPVHVVMVSPFHIGQYQVTQRQWQAVMIENPSHFKDCDDCPVESVSWNDVKRFIKKLNEFGGNFRLPSEAEWEYACRSGGQDQEYCGGKDFNLLGWQDANRGGKTHPVGQKQANGLSLYDMSGNGREWVEDCFHLNYVGAPSDSQVWIEDGSCSMRMFRGDKGLSTVRVGTPAGSVYNSMGFRLAKGDFKKVIQQPNKEIDQEELMRQELLQKRNKMKIKARAKAIKNLF